MKTIHYSISLAEQYALSKMGIEYFYQEDTFFKYVVNESIGVVQTALRTEKAKQLIEEFNSGNNTYAYMDKTGYKEL